MKIAMPSNENMINAHFGKSENFTIATITNNQIVSMETVSTKTLQHNHEGLSDFLVKSNVDVVITGGIGQGAYTPLIEKGLKVIRGASGEITSVINNYLDGSLKDKSVLCSHHHGEHGEHK